MSRAEAPDCPFCRIAAGEVEAWVVLEEPDCVAFLDARPVFPGHCLLVPREHHETLADLPPRLLEPLFAAAQRLQRAVEQGLRADGALVVINNRVSQSVAHVHVHVIPRRRKDGLRGFLWPRQRYATPDEARAVQEALRAALAEPGEG